MAATETPPSTPPPPKVASVVDLHHTPVTLGVVLSVQAIAIGAVLLIAGVIWGRLGGIETRVERLDEKVSQVREDMAGIRNEMKQVREDVAGIHLELKNMQSEIHAELKSMQRETAQTSAQTNVMLMKLLERKP